MNRYVFNILSTLVVVFIVSLIPAVLHSTYDITILKKFIGSGSTVIIAIFIFSAISNNLKNSNTIIIYFISVFLLQSLIEMIGFIQPSFLLFIQSFQDPNAREIAKFYQGMRGLALSSDIFFGLSGAYGLVYIYYMSLLINKSKINYVDSIIFLILIVGSFFVGKTGFIGLFVAFLYFLFSKIKMIAKIKITLVFILITSVILILFYSTLTENIQYTITKKLMPQVFELYYNYVDTGDYNNYSTNRLSEMLEVTISTKDYLIGSGYYTVNGHYYLHTDSGYMRHILYGGVIYVFIIFIYQLMFFLNSNLLLFKTKEEKYYFRLLNYHILLYLSILHIKGEALGTNKMILVMLVMYGLSLLKFNRKA